MKKILKSAMVIVGVVALVAGLSMAYFNDTETSTGNTFTSGAIDLKVDNKSWYNGEEGWKYQEGLSWKMDDLTGHLFFDYDDLKPGDMGADVVSLHVRNNPAYVCADLTLTSNDENDLTEPELAMGDTASSGELAQELEFFLWADLDGDNVYDLGENAIGQAHLGDAWLNQSHTFTLADSTMNVWNPSEVAGPIEGGDNNEPAYYIGKVWCYGDLEMVDQSRTVSDINGNVPAFNFTCNGEPVTNVSQTDSSTLDVSFYAVQSRHNENFTCGNYYGKEHYLKLENKTTDYQPILGDGKYGVLRFKSPYPTFDYKLDVYELNPNTEYYLHYYADPWPSTNGRMIASFTTDSLGNYSGNGSVELDADLPVPSDTNSSAKIWVIPASHWDGSKMVNWNQTQYLWEWNLVTYEDSDL